jgi:hypothetical protein
VASLFRYYPSGVLRHACRKLSRVALGHKPEALDDIN